MFRLVDSYSHFTHWKFTRSKDTFYFFILTTHVWSYDLDLRQHTYSVSLLMVHLKSVRGCWHLGEATILYRERHYHFIVAASDSLGCLPAPFPSFMVSQSFACQVSCLLWFFGLGYGDQSADALLGSSSVRATSSQMLGKCKYAYRRYRNWPRLDNSPAWDFLFFILLGLWMELMRDFSCLIQFLTHLLPTT